MRRAQLSFDDFLQKEVRRSGAIAEIVFDYSEGRPIRLIGFSADSDLTDFEILEQGFAYYEALYKLCSQ